MRKAEYLVNIESCDNGLIVRVGCKTVVVHEALVDEALNDIKLLLTGGYEGQKVVRKKWLTESDHSDHDECTDTPAATLR